MFVASLIVAFANFYINDKIVAGWVVSIILALLFIYARLSQQRSWAIADESLDVAR